MNQGFKRHVYHTSRSSMRYQHLSLTHSDSIWIEAASCSLITTMPHSENMGFWLTVVALVNGQIGTSTLIFPVMVFKAGWLPAVLVTVIICLMSLYSTHISMIHLADQPDLDKALYRHFNRSIFIKRLYDFAIWLNMMMLVIIYFKFIVAQTEGLFPPYNFTPLNPIINAVVLCGWALLLMYHDFNAHILGFGVVSLALYMVFIAWVGVTGPAGSNHIPMIGDNVIPYVTMMQSNYIVQSYCIPVLACHKTRSNRWTIFTISMAITTLMNFFISFIGGSGIANREASNNKEIQGTIYAYFEGQLIGQVLKVVYLVHLYSVIPEFLFISKRRFFSFFGINQDQEGRISVRNIAYYVCIIVVVLLLMLSHVTFETLFDINGSVLGFCFIYLLPTMMHLKCLYCSADSKVKYLSPPESPIEDHAESGQEPIELEQINFGERDGDHAFSCEVETPSVRMQIFQVSLLVFMTIFGLAVVGYAFNDIINKVQE